jgi:hypothetical protein
VLPRESQYPRPERRARRRTDFTALEALEERTLLSFSTLGFSLPDLVVTGEAGHRASWGGTLNVSVYLQNIGASSTTEPLNQLPASEEQAAGSLYNSTSSADAPASTVAVLLSRSPNSLKGSINLGSFQVPPLTQNNLAQVSATFTLPSRPAGFAGNGGKFYVFFAANSESTFQEVTHANNLSTPVAVHVAPGPAPAVRAIGLQVPSSLEAGDTIDPVAVLENFGTAPSGPLTVDLVESVTPFLTLGRSIVASETIGTLPGLSEVPTAATNSDFAEQLVNPPDNVVSVDFGLQTLSTPPPSHYFLGIVVGPEGTTTPLGLPSDNFEVVKVVGANRVHRGAAGVVSSANTGQFPTAPTNTPVGVLQFPGPGE